MSALLSFGSSVIWLAWAGHQYRGLTGCPWDLPQHGHPFLVALALVTGSTLVAPGVQWRRLPRVETVAVGLITGLLVAVVLLVVAFMFGAGLRCND
jgi:hypothetical protein